MTHFFLNKTDTSFLLPLKKEISSKKNMPELDILKAYGKKNAHFFAKVQFYSETNISNDVLSSFSLQQFNHSTQSYQMDTNNPNIFMSIQLLFLEEKPCLDVITKEQYDEHLLDNIQLNFQNNLNKKSLIFEVTASEFIDLVSYTHDKNTSIISSLEISKNKKYSPYLFKSSMNTNTHSFIFNKVMNDNNIPKQIDGFNIFIDKIDSSIYARPDMFQILSKISVSYKKHIDSTKEIENKIFLTHYTRINERLEKEIKNFEPNNPNTLFATSFVAFCRKNKAQFLTKDLSKEPTFALFYNLIKKLSELYPFIDTKISELTSIFKEKENGVNLTLLGEYLSANAPEILILDFKKFREISSLAVIRKFKPICKDLLVHLIKENDFDSLTEFSLMPRNQETYFIVIQKNKPEANQKNIWEHFDYLLNHYLLNNIEYVDDIKVIKTLLLQKSLDESIPSVNIKSNVHKF